MSHRLHMMNFHNRFPDEASAEDWFTDIRWPGGVWCPSCGSVRVKPRVNGRGRRGFRCNDCRTDFSVKTGSIMHSSPLPCRKWAVAVLLLTSDTGGVSLTTEGNGAVLTFDRGAASLPEFAAVLGVTRKSAEYMVRRIHEAYAGRISREADGD